MAIDIVAALEGETTIENPVARSEKIIENQNNLPNPAKFAYKIKKNN